MRLISQRLLVVVFCLSSIMLTDSKCINSTDFKYDLDEPSQLLGYFSTCHEFSKRTCCSVSNFESAAKRINRIVGGGKSSISVPCLERIARMVCSLCDGDIGEQAKKGVCKDYCQSVYEACRSDYFVIDSKNMLRACREEDIICSQIEDIIPSEERRSICELLSFQIDKRDCWKGEISSDVKGKGQNTIKTTQKNTVKNRPKKWGWNSKYLFYLLVIAALTAVALAVYCCHSCSQRKRQIRYL